MKKKNGKSREKGKKKTEKKEKKLPILAAVKKEVLIRVNESDFIADGHFRSTIQGLFKYQSFRMVPLWHTRVRTNSLKCLYGGEDGTSASAFLLISCRK